MPILNELSIKERVIGGAVVCGTISMSLPVALYHYRIRPFDQPDGWLAWLLLLCLVIVASAAAGWWVQRGLGEQIQKLSETAGEVAEAGDYGVRVAPSGIDEVSRLAHAFNRLLARFQQQVSTLEESRAELESWFEESNRDLMDTNRRFKHAMVETRRMEAALKDRDEQLRQSQKLEAIGRLAGGVAHDFNNQLAIIRGYVEMALDDLPTNSPISNDLAQIARAVQRSTSLTDQLLMFSSRQPMNRRQMALNNHLEDLQKMLGRLLGEDILYSLDLAEGLWTIDADPGNIDQVLTNLSVNARDAMPSGGTLTIATRNIHIDESYCRRVAEGKPGDYVRLTVADSGIGMSPRVMSKVFEPFYTTKGPEKGTGLGLSVVYGIALAHEGWITVESEVGSGARFQVYLPSVPAEEVDADPSVVRSGLSQFKGNGEHVLLIEDEDELRSIMERALARSGYVVQPCAGVEEAREAFESADPLHDLVLSDVVLPDGRGSDLVFEFLKVRPELPAILVTGYTDERADWERARAEGVELLMKPVPMARLLEQVSLALQRRVSA